MDHKYKGFRIATINKYGYREYIICGNIFKSEPSELTGHREQFRYSKLKEAKKAIDIYLETGKVKWNVIVN